MTKLLQMKIRVSAGRIKNLFQTILGTVTAMERENISCRLQSGKAQYIAKGGKVGRKTGYRKPKEEKAEQYSGVLKLLSKNYP